MKKGVSRLRLLLLALILFVVVCQVHAGGLALSSVPEVSNRNELQPGPLQLAREPPPGYLARLEQNQPAEVLAALKRAEFYYLNTGLNPDLPPISMVLHGPEVEIFSRYNYSRFKEIVDLAARLTAFGVIDINVCQTRMGSMGINPNHLFPFVGTVPFGPAEVSRLLEEEDYLYF